MKALTLLTLLLSFNVLALTNGVTVPSGEAPAVVKINDIGPMGKSTGTGVFIAPNFILTAEHVIASRDKTKIVINDVIKPVGLYYLKATMNGSQLDIAIIKVKEKSKFVMELFEGDYPSLETMVEMYGHGSSAKDDSELKKHGISRIVGINDIWVNTVGDKGKYDPKKLSFVVPGDSGGPILLNGKVMGIASKGGDFYISNYVNILSPKARKFILGKIKAGSLVQRH